MNVAVADDGVPIAYQSFGRRDGAPLLLLQGLGVDSRGWALQRFPLSRRFRCYAVGTTPAPVTAFKSGALVWWVACSGAWHLCNPGSWSGYSIG